MAGLPLTTVGTPATITHFINNTEGIMNGSPLDLSPPRTPTLVTVAAICRCLLPLPLPLHLHLRLTLVSDAAHRSGPWIPTPAFGSASRPRSAHFPQGQQGRNWESIALEGNDLGGLRRWPRLDC